jgi:hypothetical protein
MRTITTACCAILLASCTPMEQDVLSNRLRHEIAEIINSETVYTRDGCALRIQDVFARSRGTVIELVVEDSRPECRVLKTYREYRKAQLAGNEHTTEPEDLSEASNGI